MLVEHIIELVETNTQKTRQQHKDGNKTLSEGGTPTTAPADTGATGPLHTCVHLLPRQVIPTLLTTTSTPLSLLQNCGLFKPCPQPRDRSGLRVCGVQCKMKTQGPFFKKQGISFSLLSQVVYLLFYEGLPLPGCHPQEKYRASLES